MRIGLSGVKSLLGLAILAVFIVLFPLVLSNPYYLNVANIIGINTIIVVGLTLLIGYAGQVSLGHAAFYGIGAYTSAILTVTYGFNPWLALVLAALVTGSIAFIIGTPTLKLHGHYLVMATLGFNLIANIIIVQCDSVTGGPSGFPGVPPLAIGSWVFDSDIKMYCLIWSMAFIGIVLGLNLSMSRVGRGLRALHSGESAANCMGVPASKYKVKMFVLSAVFASVAGSLYAHYLSFVSPKTFDIFFSVELVTMVIVGGMGSIWGGLFGSAFLTSLPHLLSSLDEYKDIFYGFILVVILIFTPEGFIPGILQKLDFYLKEKGQRNKKRLDDFLDEPGFNGVAGIPLADSCSSKRLEASNDIILGINNISKSFGGIAAASSLTFDVQKGSITSLIGPNGAGKTTTINLIYGVYKPNLGTIIFRNNRINGLYPYQIAAMGMARTFQNLQIFDNITVLENVMVGAHAISHNEFFVSMLHPPSYWKEEKLIREKALEALSFFGLEKEADLPACQLSFGEQKRLEMARAIVSEPELILLDEPVAGLNRAESITIAGLIMKIRSRGTTVLLVEHDINVVMSISDKVVVLNYGTMIAEGTPIQIQKNELVLSAYLGGSL
jgi:branched-chain amino acid transport system permease protein